MNKLIKNLVEAIYPNSCVLCEEVLPHGSKRGICKSCEEQHPFISGEICNKCGKILVDLSSDLCHDCQSSAHYFNQGRAMWLYEEGVKSSLHNFKYKDQEENGYQFANELIRYYNECVRWSIDIVASVPLHKNRMRQRGYNQSEIIAKVFSSKLDYPLLKEGVLVRSEETRPQKELTDQERVDNVSSAFECKEGWVDNKNLLLIDDIYTTGSTVDACAKVLKQAGAKNVYYLAIAIGRGL